MEARCRRASGSFSFRPGPRWQLSVQPEIDHTIDVQQYVTTLSDGRADTYGRRYVFSSIDRTTISSEVRMSFTLRPDVNVDVYTEPFTSSGRYAGLGELLRGGARRACRLRYVWHGAEARRHRNVDRDWRRPRLSIDEPGFRRTGPSAVMSCSAGSGAPGARCYRRLAAEPGSARSGRIACADLATSLVP